MKQILLKLKLLEIILKTSGSLGYLTYCIIGLAVMFVIWMPIFKFIGWLILPFTTPILDIKDFGSLSIFGIIGYTFLLLLILGIISGILRIIFDILKSIYKKKMILKLKNLFGVLDL